MSNYNLNDVKEQITSICAEKGLEVDEVVRAIEVSIASAYRKEFGEREKAYDATFDLENGKYTVYQVTAVVDEVLNPEQQISLTDARLSNPGVRAGDIIRLEMDTNKEVEFGRIASQIAKQVLFQSINGARHTKLLQQFRDKIGEIVNVEIDYFNKGGYIVKLGQTNGFLSREHIMPTDRFKPGNIVKALIADIIEDQKGNSRVILSRTDSKFIEAIIRSEIPEVDNGIVIINKIVRDPGARSKVLVSALDGENIDPVGAILGKKNMRIINIIRQISNTMQEKIDIIEYQPQDLDLMVMDALEPAQIEKVEINEDGTKADVYCYKDEAALAVGRRGVNIRLASELLGLELNLITMEDDGSTKVGSESEMPAIILD